MTSPCNVPWPRPLTAAVMAHVPPEKHLPGCSALVEACTADRMRGQSDLGPECRHQDGDSPTAAKTGFEERSWPVQEHRESNHLTRYC